jgi:O-acetylhomoserine/O-acetylserine sulfhydrylase-like pyridoxal-dependent enzyme
VPISNVSATLKLTHAWDLYVCSMFSNILPTLGIDVRFVDGDDPAEFVAAADDKTRAFFCEGVSNPSLTIFDIEGIAEQAHSIGLPLVVDSTFSTPYLCKPFDFGADIIVSSLTKWVGGHGAGLGGIIVDSGKFAWGMLLGLHIKSSFFTVPFSHVSTLLSFQRCRETSRA